MKEIQLTQGKVALVDDEDYIKLMRYSWYANKGRKTFYAMAFNKSYHGNISMHRVVMDAPKGMQVVHINHNGLDNRKANLRIVTHRENHHNRLKKNKTGYIGVHESGKKFMARIRINNRVTHLGTYDTAEIAHNVYMDKMRELDPAPFQEGGEG